MPLSVPPDHLRNIIDIWHVGPNAIEVVTANHREVRITAPLTFEASSEMCESLETGWWTHLDLNQGPLACEASALTGLSYASTGENALSPWKP